MPCYNNNTIYMIIPLKHILKCNVTFYCNLIDFTINFIFFMRFYSFINHYGHFQHILSMRDSYEDIQSNINLQN